MHIGKRHKSLVDGIDVMSMRSDHSFPRHTHEEFSIGVMIARGHECWCCKGLVDVQAGDVIGINPGELHDGIGAKGKPRAWHMVTVSQDAIEELIDGRAESAEFLAPVFQDPQAAALVRSTVEGAVHTDGQPEELKQQLRLVFDRLLRPKDEAAQCCTTSANIDLILEQIHSDWAEDLTLEELARNAGLSKFKALRSFSAAVGTTPYAYLIQHRINRARDMMLQGICPSEAAVAAGFSDQSHMTRAFKRQIGLTPMRYVNGS